MEKNTKKEVWRFFKYLMFTCSAGIIQFGTTTLLNEVAKIDYWIAYLVGLVLSVIWNFTFNRKFTFKSANNIPIAMAKVAAYYIVFTPLSTWWSSALTGIGWNEYIVLAGTMIINFATEYLFCRFVVFGKSIDTAKGKKPSQMFPTFSIQIWTKTKTKTKTRSFSLVFFKLFIKQKFKNLNRV